jgi:hypothetical protein
MLLAWMQYAYSRQKEIQMATVEFYDVKTRAKVKIDDKNIFL